MPGALQRFQLPDNLTEQWLWQAGDTINVGDAMYDAGAGVARPAGSLTSLGTEALDQAQFAPLFLGFSEQAITATESASGIAIFPITIRVEGVALITCPSQVLTRGQLMGIYSNGTTLNAQQVDTTGSVPGTPALSIGRVIGNQISNTNWALATTQAIIAFRSVRANALAVSGGNNLGKTAATLLTDTAQSLTVKTPQLIYMVPTAARTVTLPLEAASAGISFLFSNQSAGANSVTFAGPTVTLQGNGVVPQNKTGMFWCDGATWFGMVSA